MSVPRRLLILLILLLCVSAMLVVLRRKPGTSPLSRAAIEELAHREVQALEAREAEIDRTVWSQDVLAQACGGVVEDLWDAVHASSNKLERLAQVSAKVIPPRYSSAVSLPHGIQWSRSVGPDVPWAPREAAERMRRAAADGWQLDAIELRHEQFETDPAGKPARSRFYAYANVSHPGRGHRVTLSGNVILTWDPSATVGQPPTIQEADASDLTRTSRSGPLPFLPWLNARLDPPAGSFFIDPLILRDLDRDGRPEILMVSANRMFRLGADDQFHGTAWCGSSPGLLFTAVVDDFDGDGHDDVLGARFEGLVLFPGSAEGTFERAGRLVWAATPRLKYGQVLTCGDVDGDGDLDVWLGQYKAPYDRGQMPTPYYDALDGHPSRLLLNNGRAGFEDATEAGGLAGKARRRTYSASLVDLDQDGDLDLVVVSDFAGVEFHANDGKGRFREMTSTWAPVPQAFGMAHALADFDGDGLSDFLMMGMQCPTPLRLEHLGLRRPGFERHEAMRSRMVEGNRLFRGRAGGGFEASPLNATLARSGWAWGCAAADVDCDGYPDVYISNGHETRQSVRDYEVEFWRHDIYVATSEDDPIRHLYFQRKFAATRGRGWSYGGYDKNRLFLNQGGRSFVETGHLLGVALEADCRNVAAQDLDGDGRPELIVTTFEVWPERRQTLQVFRNRMEAGHWIGLRLHGKGGRSPVGSEVTIEREGRRMVRSLVTGDSHRTQHAPGVHFGLGPSDRVDRLEVRWPGGKRTVLSQPGVDRYHDLTMEP